jgi:Domain of unknown function (DUF4390)
MTRVLSALVAAVALAAAAAAADEIEVGETRLVGSPEGVVLNADFALDLTPRLEDALAQGVPLYFVVEFESYRPRWYWLDERIGAATLTARLSFHALTRTYRLSTGTLHQSFATLNEAMRALGTVREWLVLPPGTLRPDTAYDAYVRMRLDTAQLPKPFQVSALANRDWSLASAWKKWQVDGAAAVSKAAQ